MKENLIIKCEKNENYDYDKRVTEACGCYFNLGIDNIFENNTLDYFSETIEEYYTICPNCGYMVLLDDNILSEDEKKYIKNKNIDECYLYRKNKLKSEYKHFEYLERKGKSRIRKI